MYSNCDTPNLISKGHLIFLPNPVPNFSSTVHTGYSAIGYSANTHSYVRGS